VYKELDTTNDEYVLLTVWTEGYSGNVKVEYPNTLIPDNTNSVMRTVSQGYGIVDTVSFSGTNKYSSHVYRFFADDTVQSALDVEKFTVSYGDDFKNKATTKP
jgi:hypothetical protein